MHARANVVGVLLLVRMHELAMLLHVREGPRVRGCVLLATECVGL